MISLRKMVAADADLLSRIGGASLLESHGHSAPAEIMEDYVSRSFSVDACLRELSDERNHFYLVTYGHRPAGYSKFVLGTTHALVPQGLLTKLERLYLLKEFYGLALGDRLLHHAIRVSADGGDRGMWLNVWKENGRALKFYEKNGFEIVGEAQFVLTPRHSNPNWVMWRPMKMQ